MKQKCDGQEQERNESQKVFHDERDVPGEATVRSGLDAFYWEQDRTSHFLRQFLPSHRSRNEQCLFLNNSLSEA
jgi:hypothetical protein